MTLIKAMLISIAFWMSMAEFFNYQYEKSYSSPNVNDTVENIVLYIIFATFIFLI